MKKDTSSALVAILIVTQVLSYFKISNLEREIEEIKNYTMSAHDTVNSSINSLYFNMEEKLDKQASYIEHIETTIGTPNGEDLTVPITYTIIPKEVTDNTFLSLDFNGEVLKMDRDGTTFSLTLVSEIFNPETYPNIVITEDDVTKTEKNDLLNIYSLKNGIFQNSNIHLRGSARGNGKEYKRTGTIKFDMDPPKGTQGFVELVDARFVTKVDDDIISDKAIDINDLNGYEINEEVALEDGQTYTMYIVLEDSLNLEHHYMIDHYVQGNNAQREPFYDNEEIYSQDGTLLWPQE